MAELEKLKEKYWQTLRRTRSSGRIAPSVIEKTEEKWRRYDEDVVTEALKTHVSRYPDRKENYTLGIMRNMQRTKDAGGVIHRETQTNMFNRFEQRTDIDFEALERELVANRI